MKVDTRTWVVTVRPWRMLYSLGVTLVAAIVLGWPGALVALAASLDIEVER